MADKINTGLNAWQRLSNMFVKSPVGFFVALVVLACAYFLYKGNGDEGKWRGLYEKERQANIDCETEGNRRYDSLQREYNLFLKGYAPLVQKQIERTENLKDSIKNNSHE